MAWSIVQENVVDLDPSNPEVADEYVVPSTTLDNYCANRKFVLDVIKIDVEGAELLVLRGAEKH